MNVVITPDAPGSVLLRAFKGAVWHRAVNRAVRKRNLSEEGKKTLKKELRLVRLPGHRVRRQLEAGTYTPGPVRWRERPKPGGKVRRTAMLQPLDQTIDTALMLALQEALDSRFSDSSYGYL